MLAKSVLYGADGRWDSLQISGGSLLLLADPLLIKWSVDFVLVEKRLGLALVIRLSFVGL